MTDKKRFIRILLATLMSVAMVLVAEIFGEREIIFPEITAILVGAWCVPKQPWRVTKIRMVALMTISAVAGILLASLEIPMLAKVIIGYAFTAISLIISQTTMVPMISACILPVLLSTTTIIYPISVFTMVTLIAVVAKLLEKRGLKPVTEFEPVPVSADIVVLWAKRFIFFSLLCAVPILTKNYYFVAPPLIVAFTEFASPTSKVRSKPFATTTLLVLSALAGTLSRMLLGEVLGLPLTVCALVSVIVLFGLFELTKVTFAPAGAISFLPLILGTDGLWLYPVEVMGGATILVFTAMLLFKGRRVGERSHQSVPQTSKI